MKFTQRELVALLVAGVLVVTVALAVVWRMDQRETRLMRLAIWQTCMLTSIHQSTSNGAVVDGSKYNAIADDCRR